MSSMLTVDIAAPSDWQTELHMPERQLMLNRLAYLMRQRTNCTALTKGRSAHQLPDIARRLELILYSRAASFEEYRNVFTVKRRLRHLISSLFRQAEHERPHILGKSHIKRSIEETIGDIQQQTQLLEAKRPRIQTTPQDGAFLFNNDFNLTAVVFSYLSGAETMRCAAVNKSACTILPKTIQSLQLKTTQLRLALTCGFASQVPQVQDICIYRDQIYLDLGNTLAADCAPLDITSSNSSEQLIKEFAILLSSGAFPELRKLSLCSTFASTSSINAIGSLCEAFGALPKLSSFCIGGNSIGDEGASAIAEAIAAGHCARLTHLDIRGNFIGEKGCFALCRAIQNGPMMPLQELCFGGNILNNRCAIAISQLLHQQHFPELQFLGLEFNFIETECLDSIFVYYGSLQCPRLNYISCDGNTGMEDPMK